MRSPGFKPALAAALPLAMARHKLLSGAWREHCGHQRPQTDRNFPPLAEAEEKVASIQADMQGLLTSRDVELTLERAGQPDAPAGSEHRGAGLTVRLVSEVAAVQAGQPLAVMEAMKMELSLKSPRAGTIAEVRASAGDFVEADAVLVVLE